MMETHIQSANINGILESISVMPLNDQFFITDTLNKRMIDLRRNQILIRAKEAEENYKEGKVFTGSVTDLIKAAVDND